MNTVKEVLEAIKSEEPLYVQIEGAHYSEILESLRASGFTYDKTRSKTFTKGSQCHLIDPARGLRVELIQACCLGTFTAVTCSYME